MNNTSTSGNALRAAAGDVVPGTRTADQPDVESVLRQAVASGSIPGAVGVITDTEHELFRGAFGYADHSTARTFDEGDLFRIASAVKLWTSVLLMQLVEERVLTLDDPIGRYLPEFDALPVLAGFDGGEPVLVEPVRSPTIREVAAHLGGLSYAFSSELNLRYGTVADAPRGWGALDALTKFPRTAQPGEQPVYGTGFDWIGLAIERVTGEKLEDRFRARLLDPIGMHDTFYRLDPAASARVAPTLSAGPAGRWSRSALGFDYLDQPEFCQGGGHMYTTPFDYAKLMRVLLAGGLASGGRILSSASVDQMFRPLVPHSRIEMLRTAAPVISGDITIGVGDRWGMGLVINDHDVPGMRRAGSGGWVGLWNTFFWADRTSGLAGALFMQTLPFGEPGAVQTFSAFERAAYAQFGRR